MNGPFRKYETGNSGTGLPGYYADFLTVPGHPEFDGNSSTASPKFATTQATSGTRTLRT